LYLESEEIKVAANGGTYLPNGDETEQTPLFLGRRFAYQGDKNEIYNLGGSGYTMNKVALKALVVNGLPNYFPHVETFAEDTRVAAIFRKMGIFPYETKDEAGEERYLPFTVSGMHGLSHCVCLFLIANFALSFSHQSLISTTSSRCQMIQRQTGIQCIPLISSLGSKHVRREVLRFTT
jgi:hypothetical protein